MKQMLILAACVLAAPWAQADGDKRARVPLLPAYVQECGSCHVAFAPGLLPAASWQRQMNGLDKHYGTDASMDASVAKSIGRLADRQRRHRQQQARRRGPARRPHQPRRLVRARAPRIQRALQPPGGEDGRQLRRLPHPRRRRQLPRTRDHPAAMRKPS
jgi:hypothetical protein